jgi:hypothetical protein
VQPFDNTPKKLIVTIISLYPQRVFNKSSLASKQLNQMALLV